MTRVTLAAAALVALAACGNYSTEDLRFVAALPTRDDLRVEVPAQAPAAGALTACGAGTSEVWGWAKPTSDKLNGAVDFVLGLVDAVRRRPPSWRDDDARAWGPWDDDRHPGRELSVVIARTYPAELGGAPRHAYLLQARPKGSATWTPILAGNFDGASARRGSGGLALDFDAIWSLAMNDADTPHGTMLVRYARSADPATVEIVLGQDGFGVVQFGYRYAGWTDGRGWFAYGFRNAAGDLLTVGVGFDAAGAGDAQVAFQTAGGATGGFRQCWDASACLVYVLDPASYSCAAAPCSLGDATACAAVPASPFPP